MTKIRAAVVQATTTLFSPDAAIDAVEALTAEAAGRGAQLVVFPEAFVGGYLKGSDLGAVIGRRSDEGRDLFRTLHDSAIPVPGPHTRRIGAIAAAHRVHLVVGVIEQDDATVYCTMVTFDADGRMRGAHRKLSGVGSERLIYGWGDGSGLEVHDTSIGRLGTLMCWENLMPAARMSLYAQGVQLYCAPNAVGTELDISTLRHIAREGRCFVLAAHLLILETSPAVDNPGLSSAPMQAGLSRGGSCIIGPDGALLAGPEWDEHAILVADLDFDDIVRWKYDFDVTGHFARPDIFRLTVDMGSRHPVAEVGGPDTATDVESPHIETDDPRRPGIMTGAAE